MSLRWYSTIGTEVATTRDTFLCEFYHNHKYNQPNELHQGRHSFPDAMGSLGRFILSIVTQNRRTFPKKRHGACCRCIQVHGAILGANILVSCGVVVF